MNRFCFQEIEIVPYAPDVHFKEATDLLSKNTFDSATFLDNTGNLISL